MQLFQAAALGNENMQDVVRQVLKTVDDPIWKKEGSIDKICHVEISEEYDGQELAKQCKSSNRVSIIVALEQLK